VGKHFYRGERPQLGGERISVVIVFRNLNEVPPAVRGGAVAVGNFDGVHQGHGRLIARLLTAAKQLGGPAVVFTFDPPPSYVLQPYSAAKPLLWRERKEELLAALGVDAALFYPPDKNFLALEPEDFFHDVICRRFQAEALVEGANFSFGRNRRGNVKLLARLASAAGIVLDVVEPLTIEGQIVSSSRVRALLLQGATALAGKLLGRPHRIRGTVVSGAGRGSRIGFPTANLEHVEVLLPKEGVYAGRAWVDTACYPAAVSLGPNPTFGEGRRKIEVHLIGFSGRLEGRTLEVDFLERLRDIITFTSVEALQAEIAADIDRTLKLNS